MEKLDTKHKDVKKEVLMTEKESMVEKEKKIPGDEKGIMLHEEKQAIQCDPCAFDNEIVPATAFCRECLEYLCKACCRDHRKIKLTRNHRLLQDYDMPATKKVFEYLNNLLHCKNHPNKEVELKCCDHDVYICSVCEGRMHRKCENVTEIQELTQVDTDRSCTGSLMQEINQCIDFAVKHNKHKHETLTLMSKDTEEALAEIETNLDKLRKQASQTVETLAEQQTTALESAIKEGNIFIADCEKEKQMLQIALKYGTTKQVHLVAQTMKESVPFLDKRLQSFKGNERHRLEFSSNLEKLSSFKLGSFTIVDERSETQIWPSIDEIKEDSYTDETHAGSDAVLEDGNGSNLDTKISNRNDTERSGDKGKHFDEPLMDCSIAYVGTYNVRQNNRDNVCNIYGCILLPDRIILIDNNNSSLLMFDEDFAFRTRMILSSKPLGICSINDKTVMVTLESRKVPRYSVEDRQFSFLNEFGVRLHCRGISKARDNVAFLMSEEDFYTTTDSVQVQIRRVNNGQKIRVIENFTDVYGSHIEMDDPRCLLYVESENPNEDCILIGDSERLSYINVNSCCEEKFFKSYKDHPIDGITGIACDDEGNVFICGYGSNNVHQISLKDFFVSKLRFIKVSNVRSVAFDCRAKRLITSCENSDFIHICKFTMNGITTR